ncbi:Ion transport domain [Dillenia turbinata]|uniref:Ion transport domain n=1 Tax=Dillenia turbinata TaxID=194707 RepID=A0AAN8Z515_9MAGN
MEKWQISELSLSDDAVEEHQVVKLSSSKGLCRVFPEDFRADNSKILDPQGQYINVWNKIFFGACLISLFVDPMFLYMPATQADACADVERRDELILTLIRSLADFFYLIQIYVRFHTAYVAPDSRVFGRGELVIEPQKIAMRYLDGGFWIDLFSALPLPQVLVWGILPNLGGSPLANLKNALRFVIIIQYLPKLYIFLPLSLDIVKATGVMVETAFAGVMYNMLLFLLVGHVLGASWYLLSLVRLEACWKSVCESENSSCPYGFFDCRSLGNSGRDAWFMASNITTICDPSNSYYQYGIYGQGLIVAMTSEKFFNKYFYGLWWGVQQLCCLGQTLYPTVHIGEINFAMLACVLGLILFALLVANMQRYYLSATIRIEDWRIKMTNTEEWMHQRQLPPELRECVRKYERSKWVTTQGVDEESLFNSIPPELHRAIKRHLCLDLVRQVPVFDQMDGPMLDAICERLRPALCTQGTFLVCEGDAIYGMLFIIRGHLESHTTDGGHVGFVSSCNLGPGDFCGDELLVWALDPRPNLNLPSSTRTIRAISDVEAFALTSDDLRFVALQFRRLHSKQVRYTFRFYSPQWRTWAACIIQAAWRRYKKPKEASQSESGEEFWTSESSRVDLRYDIDGPPPGPGLAD